jgi:hypothetical protein
MGFKIARNVGCNPMKRFHLEGAVSAITVCLCQCPMDDGSLVCDSDMPPISVRKMTVVACESHRNGLCVRECA